MASAPSGRITFAGNPWPQGHAIAEFALTGALSPTGEVRLHLHLQSEPYGAGDEAEDGDDSDAPDDWSAKIVWSNSGRCTLSSTHWGGEATGIPVAGAGVRFDPTALDGRTFHVDPRDEGETAPEEAAFGLYLLGHDAVADHRMRFQRRGSEPLAFDIDWVGRIALTYAGDDTLDHAFAARVEGARFLGLSWTGERDPAAFTEALARAVTRPDLFRLGRFGRRLFADYLG